MTSGHPITANELSKLIPHDGTMCLLDTVSDWDDTRIVCTATSHQRLNHPLRSPDGSLAALHAFEYAAQASAVHGALCARVHGLNVTPGYLAALNDGQLHLAHLDTLNQALQISAERLFFDAGSTMYRATVHAVMPPDYSQSPTLLATVRMTVMRGSAT